MPIVRPAISGLLARGTFARGCEANCKAATEAVIGGDPIAACARETNTARSSLIVHPNIVANCPPEGPPMADGRGPRP